MGSIRRCFPFIKISTICEVPKRASPNPGTIPLGAIESRLALGVLD